MSAWTGKVCAKCGKKKGKRQANLKYCWTCANILKKDRSRGAHSRAIEERYGLSGPDYDRLYDYQDGLCFICRVATGATRRLSVDHDHVSGDVRGLLCRPCNTLLGRAGDNIEFFERAIAYLTNPPYAAMKNG